MLIQELRKYQLYYHLIIVTVRVDIFTFQWFYKCYNSDWGTLLFDYLNICYVCELVNRQFCWRLEKPIAMKTDLL